MNCNISSFTVPGTVNCHHSRVARGVSTRILPLMPDQVIAVLEHRLLLVDWDSEMFEADYEDSLKSNNIEF